jgi:predicted ATP-dependent serine protease
MSSKIMNVKSLSEKKFDTLDLGDYNKQLGQPESKCTIMVYGPSGSGKSVWVMQLADHFAKNIGKTLYDSHEERLNQTLRDRIVKFGITAPKLYFSNGLTFEELMKKIRSNYYRCVIIDSVQYALFTVEQLKELRHVYAKRKIMVVLVSFGTAVGSTKNANDLLHAADIKCFVKAGTMEVISRYLHEPQNIRLFKPNTNQLALDFSHKN